MGLPKRELLYTPEEYLTFERASKTKHEYLNGQIHAMAGGSPPHNQICFNTNVAIGVQIKGTPCIGYTSDQKIRTDPMDLFSYPDLTIVCGKLLPILPSPLTLVPKKPAKSRKVKSPR
jgi:Uma2 family endonuclease